MRVGLLLLAVAASAQTPPATFPVSGTVVNSVGGGPVTRALVTATCFPTQKEGSGDLPANGPLRLAAVTDETGVFRLSGVPAGNCELSAQKPNFVESEGDSSIVISGAVTDARLSLDPLGVITGKVTDQDGVPVYGATILIVTLPVENGLRSARLSRTVRTNDLGVFRVWNLRPGKYYVKAAGKRAASSLYSADNGPIGVFPDAFAPTYFGGGATLASATPVVIGKGAQVEADIRITWKPAFQISGTIENFTARTAVQFELSIDGEEFTPSSVNVHGDTGRFEILDVLPGVYRLRARQGENWAERTVAVQGNVKGVVVQLAPPVDISVTERVSGPGAGDPSELRVRPFRFTPGCSVTLHEYGYPPSDASVPRVVRTEGMRGGPAALKGVRPGTYRAVFECNHSYIQTAVFGTQDLLANPVITVEPGTAPPGIELVSRTGGGSVTVEVPSKNEETLPLIILAPQFTPSAGPVHLNGSGRFGGPRGRSLEGLAPGAYLAFALLDREAEYRNPEFLKSLRGGVPIQISEGAETKVILTEVIR